MAIQFFCAACRQPIEIDDDAANQVVTCPYCRKVVTAPAVSDPAVHRGTPEARPPSEPYAMGPSAPPPVPYQSGNRMAWISLAFATLMILCTCIGSGMFLTLLRDEGLLANPPDQAKMQQYVLDQQKSPSPGMLRIQKLFLMVPIFGIAGIVLGIVSIVGNKRPKWPGIVALVVCAGFLLMMCMATALSLASVRGKV